MSKKWMGIHLWYNMNMSKLIKDKIDYALEKKCTRQQEVVLKYLRQNLGNINRLTAAKVAEKCYCSTSAVNRSVKRIGFIGFTEFKNFEIFQVGQELVQEQATSKELFHTFINKILDDINYDEIEALAPVLLSSNPIYVYGSGVSNVSSLFLFRQLLNLGLNVVYIPDFDLLSAIRQGVLFIISSTGENERVNQFLEENFPRDIVAITRQNSNLDRLSTMSITHNIDLDSVRTFEREQQIQILLLIDALVEKLANEKQ